MGSGSGECHNASGREKPAIRDEKTYNLTHLGGEFGDLLEKTARKRRRDEEWKREKTNWESRSKEDNNNRRRA